MQVLATGQAVSHRAHIVEAQVSRVTPCGINALELIIFGALRFPYFSYLSTHSPQSFTYYSLIQQSGAHTLSKNLEDTSKF
jgi:hypothetical protein